MAKIEVATCRQYNPGDFVVVRPKNWAKLIEEDDNDEHGADPGAPSCGWWCHGDGNDNEDGEGQEDT